MRTLYGIGFVPSVSYWTERQKSNRPLCTRTTGEPEAGIHLATMEPSVGGRGQGVTCAGQTQRPSSFPLDQGPGADLEPSWWSLHPHHLGAGFTEPQGVLSLAGVGPSLLPGQAREGQLPPTARKNNL